MEKRIIGRGLLAGALAGVFAFVFARIFLEPVISRAIGYEEGRSEVEEVMAGHHDHEMELFSRGIQANIGMGLGVLGFSVAMGALFAVAFVVVYSKTQASSLGASSLRALSVKTLSVRALSLILAAGAFVTVYLVPFIKYPANPPAIGDPDTIGKRAGLYLLMMALSVAFAGAAVWLGRRLALTLGNWEATLSGIGAYIVAVVIAMLLLPTVSEVPKPVRSVGDTIVYPGFSADDLFEFRLYAVGTQVIIWATIGLVFGALVSRLLADSRRESITV